MELIQSQASLFLKLQIPIQLQQHLFSFNPNHDRKHLSRHLNQLTEPQRPKNLSLIHLKPDL
jgi:hypothetical protein